MAQIIQFRKPTKAHRKPTTQTTASCRGAMPNPITGHEVVFESNLERKGLKVLFADPRLVDLHEQQMVSFRDHLDRPKKHVFDCVAHFYEGTRIAYAFKPASKVAKSGLRKTLQQVEIHNPGFADRYVILTENQITPEKVHNAELTLKARRMRNEQAIEELKSVLPQITSPTSIGEIMQLFRNNYEGFFAVVNLIFEGRLQRLRPGFIDKTTLVEVA